MSLPQQFINRWPDRPGPSPFQDSVCWHLLVGDQPPVRATVRQAQQRLAGFSGLRMTPMRWLHITVLRVGSIAEITEDGLKEMLSRARLLLSSVQPVAVTFRRVLYHPEAIALGVSPESALSHVFAAAQVATQEVIGITGSAASSWTPHLTLCYSTSQQPAAPIIAALGKEVPRGEAVIDKLSLVIQRGPEPRWDWHHVGTASLQGAHDEAGYPP
jgi:2'-5' RNA ligase